MKVKYLVKNLEGVNPFSFVVAGGMGTRTSNNLTHSLSEGPLHPNLERYHGFTMCIPGEFL